MFTKSIRGRLLLWLAFLLVCILSGFGVTAYQLHRINLFRQVDEALERRVAAVSSDVRGRGPLGHAHAGPRREPEPGHQSPDQPPPDSWPPKGPPDLREPRQVHLSSSTVGLFDEQDSLGFYFAVWSRNGTLLKRSTNAPSTLPPPTQADADTRPRTRTRDTMREAYHFTELGDCILAGRSVAPDLTALNRFAWWLVMAGAAILAIGLGGGWALATRAFRPVQKIGDTARRIAAGNLSERIDMAETDSELGQLAGVLNSTFARLDAAFAEQKQFTADASHELRTPLAVIISETQTTLTRERSPAEYRETVETCLDAAQQMRRLTESLLQLARFDAGQELMRPQAFDLADIVQQCIDRVRPLAAEHGIQIQSNLSPAEIQGDPDRLSQVITNLLTNALQYNRDHGQVQAEVRTENGLVCLQVSNTGPGISPVDLPHIFERFYRGDKSRSQSDGRNGLGLAIAKAIVDAHGGKIEASSQPGEGATFTVRLPKHS